MSQDLLQNRDYTIILARNASKTFGTQPGLDKQWLLAQESIIALAKKCEELDPDGLTIYIASTPYQKYDNTTSQALVDLFEQPYGSDSINVVEPLKVALDDHFSRKSRQQTKANGDIIIVILDSEPKPPMAVVKLLVAATNKMDSQEELGVMFAQVGEDPITRGFLTALDDDLHAAGAKLDIADTKLLSAMEESQITKFLLDALYD
ncbi:MAG: hypothetical protein F6K37_26960 [Moorea sp. SIO4E2]|uniref:hypothetical protein n=1 Tax=Moorena sp. SIO4E2 TaxID=2607826 RepID=UPI0013B92070|nr:hypothetical protein [Moorena sp. SIO4E2]NEQ09456.1 hypothetical protein [Moorena sp. SIO4E2]